MSLDDPTLSIENDESIHKKHKIFSDNKYLKNKSRRGKKNRQRLRQVENRDEIAMVHDRRGGGGGGGGSENGSDYNTQEQSTPVKNIDGDSRRQLDHSEIRGGNGPDHPVSFSRGRGHTVKSTAPSTSLIGLCTQISDIVISCLNNPAFKRREGRTFLSGTNMP